MKVWIDYRNHLYRAHYAAKALQNNGYGTTYQFFNMLNTLILTLKPTSLGFADDGKPEYRLGIFPEYKANRIRDEETKIDMKKNDEKIKDILRHSFPVTYVRHATLEADDILYSISKKSKDEDIVFVSSDKDVIKIQQLNPRHKIWNPAKKEFHTIPDYDITVFKSLVGDKGDNIPGVKGVGEVKALKLISEGNFIESFDDEKKKQYEISEKLVNLIEIDSLEESVFQEYFKGPSFDIHLFSEKINELGFEKSLGSKEKTFKIFCALKNTVGSEMTT